MKQVILSLAVVLGMVSTSLAQDSVDSTKAVETASIDKYDSWKNKHAIALSAGLPGFGLEYAYNINRSFNVRAGFTAFGLSDINTDLEVNGQNINVNANLNSMAFDLLFEYQPSSKVAFKLVAGLGYLNNVGFNSLVLLNDDIGFGDLVIDNEDIGEIDIDIAWGGVSPYLGFGFGRAIPKKRVGFGLEFGAYYAGGPEVEIVATDMLENTGSEAEQLEENLASYAWVPRIMARLAIKL